MAITDVRIRSIPLTLFVAAVFSASCGEQPTAPFPVGGPRLDHEPGHADGIASPVLLGPEIRITSDPADQFFPEISGDRVVWWDLRHDAGDIYLFDFATAVEVRITDDPAIQFAPTISGDLIAFSDRRHHPLSGVYLFDLATGEEMRITTEPSIQAFPHISGDRIIWQDLRNSCDGVTPCDRSGNDDIYGFDLAAGVEIPIITHPAAQQQPDLFEDRAVWQDWRNGPPADIYMFDFSTGAEIQVTSGPGHERRPEVFRDLVVYDDFDDVFLTDLATGTRTRITDEPEAQQLADVWGRRIVWSDSRNGHCDIYLFDLVTETEVRVTDDPGCQAIPTIWGNRVVWMDNRNGNWDIYGRELIPPTLENLQDALETCVADGSIANDGVAQSLRRKIGEARDAEARGDIGAALGLLEAFVSQLEAQAGEAVDEPCATDLAAMAGAVAAELGG